MKSKVENNAFLTFDLLKKMENFLNFKAHDQKNFRFPETRSPVPQSFFCRSSSWTWDTMTFYVAIFCLNFKSIIVDYTKIILTF